IGPNNAGKSSLIRALYLMQSGSQILASDIRLGEREAAIDIGLDGPRDALAWRVEAGDTNGTLQVRLGTNAGMSFTLVMGQHQQSLAQLPSEEPGHFVVPYLS